eukprot:5125427-Amphidinium_carterae.1
MAACMKLVADTKSIDLVQIHAEARRASMQIGQMFDYFEDRFKTLLVACRQSGCKAKQAGQETDPLTPPFCVRLRQAMW